MVTTRSATPKVAADSNRIIAVVTGANSGFGFGICQHLLTNLSLPVGTPIPASRPQRTALAPSQQYLLDDIDKPEKEVPQDDPPTLTLILACRSIARAEVTRAALLRKHDKELAKRERKGMPVRKNWRQGLRLVCEQVDLGSPGGMNGLLAFCGRMEENHHHITTLFLNAGMGPYIGFNVHLWAKSLATRGIIATFSRPGTWTIEEMGQMSADGERGMAWGVNVLASYILVKELLPLLQRSPSTLTLAPRIIYTGSGYTGLESLKPDPLDDPQFLTYASPYQWSCYSATKTMGEFIMVQLDQEITANTVQKQLPVRCLTADPGCVVTNIFNEGLGGLEYLYWTLWSIAFYLCRLLGSSVHPIYANEGALSIMYAALVDNKYLSPATKVPAQKFGVISTRWGKTLVGYGEVGSWEEGQDIGQSQVKTCEAIRLKWRRREGLE